MEERFDETDNLNGLMACESAHSSWGGSWTEEKLDALEKYINAHFRFVTEKPLVLYNTRNTPIFHFACASNNETAIKIASQIIKKKQAV